MRAWWRRTGRVLLPQQLLPAKRMVQPVPAGVPHNGALRNRDRDRAMGLQFNADQWPLSVYLLGAHLPEVGGRSVRCQCECRHCDLRPHLWLGRLSDHKHARALQGLECVQCGHLGLGNLQRHEHARDVSGALRACPKLHLDPPRTLLVSPRPTPLPSWPTITTPPPPRYRSPRRRSTSR